MKGYKKLLKYLCVSLFLLLIISSCKKESNEQYIPGSFKALELFTHVRSFPNHDIPKAGYFKAFQKHKDLINNVSSRSVEGTWDAIGSKTTAGRTLTIAVNPQDPNTIYAGSASGGIWRSRTLGQAGDWERIETDFPVLGVSTIAFAEGDSTLMFIGTGEVYNINETGNDGAYRSTRGSYGIGILKSEDGGETWTHSLDWSYAQGEGVWMIKISKSNPDLVYAATTEGVMKSEDRGESWVNVFPNDMVTDLEINPDNEDEIVVSCGNFDSPDKGIYYTEDAGQSWESSLNVPETFQGKILLARSNSNPSVVYASVGNGFTSAQGFTWLLRSEDGGKIFTTVNETDYSRWQGWFSHDIAVSPDNPDELIAVGIDIFKTVNGGTTLDKMSNGGVTLGVPPLDGPDGGSGYSHSDHHFVMYHPEIEDLILIANDGGVFLSKDRGLTFESSNVNMQTTQFYNGFSVSGIDENFVMGGLQDNSTSIYTGSESWRRAIGGDGSWTAINPFDDTKYYGSSQNLNMVRSLGSVDDNSYQNIRPPLSGDSPLFIAPFVLCPSEPNILYAGARYIYKGSDNGSNFNWIRVNNENPLNGDPVFAMAVSDVDSDVLYVGTAPEDQAARIFITTDGGNSFTSASPVPFSIVNDLTVYPGQPGKAIAVYSGFGNAHVWRTEDFGASWDDITANLPDVPTNAVVVDPYDDNYIYIGNDLGVYYSDNGGESYLPLHDGLPTAVIAMDLKISTVNDKLWVATHGNGTYNIDLISKALSVNESNASNLFTIYPNPTINKVFIDSETSESFEIELFNSSGQLISKHKNTTEINVKELDSGAYFLIFTSEGRRLTKHLIKQ